MIAQEVSMHALAVPATARATRDPRTGGAGDRAGSAATAELAAAAAQIA